jgi:hypothetical protein
MLIHSSTDLKDRPILEAHFAKEIMSSNSFQQGRQLVHFA